MGNKPHHSPLPSRDPEAFEPERLLIGHTTGKIRVNGRSTGSHSLRRNSLGLYGDDNKRLQMPATGSDSSATLTTPVSMTTSSRSSSVVSTASEMDLHTEKHESNMIHVNVLGTVDGAIQTVHGDITIRGNVHGDIRTTHGTVTVVGSVSGNVHSVSGKIKVKNQRGEEYV